MEIIVVKNYEELSDEAFKRVIKVINSKRDASLGLATGSSPIGLYQRLIKEHEENGMDFSNVKTYNLDEYFGIPKGHSQSYYNFMNENLFNHINIKKENINIPSGHTNLPQEECDHYNDILNNTKIDIQILGIGSNGHIGFNEPGTPFELETHFIELDEQTREDNARFFDSIDEVPTHAITMGIRNIMNSKKILLLASGKSKAYALNEVINGPVTQDLPASILQLHPDVVMIIDEDAASLIIKSKYFENAVSKCEQV